MTTVFPVQRPPRVLTFEQLDKEYPPAARGLPAVQPPATFDAGPSSPTARSDSSRAGSSKTDYGFGRTSSQSSMTSATDDGMDAFTSKRLNIEIVLGVVYFYVVAQQNYKATPESEPVQSDYADAKLQFDNLIKIFHSNTLPSFQQFGVSSLLDSLAYFQVEHS